jgi:anti-sigma-K factor RskA
MEADTLHDLTAAYALDALDSGEARAYEAHLARCERCRAELASLSEAAGALAYATESPPPPPELRARILQQAAHERSNVVPLRPRWVVPVAAIATVAACAAVALGLWAASLSSKLDRRAEALSEQERVAAILAQPASRRIPIEGGQGTLVVTPMGQGVLVLNRLRPAESGRTYEAWIARGGSPEPAGTFDGGRDVVLVRLKRPVTEGSAVMVTEERDGGTAAPTGNPFVTVQYPAQS